MRVYVCVLGKYDELLMAAHEVDSQKMIPDVLCE